ncbi:MAG: asparagine synthase (glutamine-hydrolyzing) [Bacteroidia bacterium]|nr:asparagine synthase (glutamine-hydrolyzing) [Bacteroidia bacterium]
MCGIAGFTGEYDLEKASRMIRQATDAIAHRGPNSDGHFVRAGVALGHRRLSIIDLSAAANQPMADASGRYTMVYNGEVYNYEEVRAQLPPGYTFQSNSDTDVVLAAYITWGPACLSRLNGMFALAIWDEVEQSLFIARDRLGIKPLYYTWQNGQLGFASEVRPLIRSGVAAPVLNRAALPEYLRYYTVHAPRTLVEGVHQLMPGTYGLVKDGALHLHRYWSLTAARTEASTHDYAQTCTRVRELLRDAVQRRLISDVPLGAFLSGGIDSSAIVALMATVSETPVHTFSIIFDEKAFDESPYSSLIARKYGTQHHPIKLSPGDFLRELPRALAALDHPSGDGLNSYVVSEATKKTGFTVALSGLGGDELFAGYPVFTRYEQLLRHPLYRIPRPLRQAGAALAGVLRNNHQTERLKGFLTAETPDFQHLYPTFRKLYDDAELSALIGQPAPPNDVLQQVFSASELQDISRLPVLSQVSAGEIATYTQNVLLRDTDQMSMAHALEVRVPFFDYTLVDYVMGIPDVHKYPASPKKLLVDAMGDLIPAEIVNRPKMGFVFPWAHWLRHDLRPLAERHLQALGQREGFDAAFLAQFWAAFQAGDTHATWMKLWMLIALNAWMEQNEIQ